MDLKKEPFSFSKNGSFLFRNNCAKLLGTEIYTIFARHFKNNKKVELCQ
jgi:hypothetical protein